MHQRLQLIKLSCPENDDLIAGHVIFIHGLGGHPYETWQANKSDKDSYWPLWIAEDLNSVCVWTLSYDSRATKWFGDVMSLQDRTVAVRQCLLDEEALSKHPIVFVSHSLGGLIVKQLVRKLSDPPQEHGFQSFLDRISGVIFYGTPHTGSSLANVASTFSSIIRPSKLTKMLRAHEPQLTELNHYYRNCNSVLRIEHRVYFETKSKVARVVDPTSSDPGIMGITPIPLDGDHYSICKPISRDDQRYKSTLSFIRDRALNSELLQSKLARKHGSDGHNKHRGDYFQSLPGRNVQDRHQWRSEIETAEIKREINVMQDKLAELVKIVDENS